MQKCLRAVYVRPLYCSERHDGPACYMTPIVINNTFSINIGCKYSFLDVILGSFVSIETYVYLYSWYTSLEFCDGLSTLKLIMSIQPFYGKRHPPPPIIVCWCGLRTWASNNFLYYLYLECHEWSAVHQRQHLRLLSVACYLNKIL